VFEKPFIQLTTGHTFRQFEPMVETPISRVNAQTHVFECLSITFALPIVVLLYRLARLLNSLRLKELDGIVL
jgi:hypothetical protein